MANRAYLYSSDCPDAWKQPEEGYYDSRWTIPLAWFFLFRPGDVRLIDVASWKEVRLSAEKISALDVFRIRRPLLMSLIGHRISGEEVEQFIATIRERPGRHLLMNPDEVLCGFGDDDEVDADRFTRICEVLGDGDGSAEAAREATLRYVGDLDPDPLRCECQVLGYTYSWPESLDVP